jgi:predicted signal transduction protein with EAL and GGDEF domain
MFICVLRDVTEMEDNKKKIYDLAFRDSLTGSFNIQKFRADMVEDELSNCYLLAFQLESFYFLTQAYGQDVSDNILLLLVHQISTQLPKHATLYRLEGVRFVVHCHTQGIDKASIENKALQLVELIRTAIEAPYSLGPNGHKLSAHYSIVLPDEGDDATSLLLKLELALNNAWKKKQKQNIYSERMLEEFFAKKNLEQSLLASIENEELYLQFQPQFRADGEPVSSEVLLRWNSKLYGFVSPDEFIPIAENNGFVIELTYWVIEQVFKTLDNIPIGLRHRVSINISPTDILQPNFSTFIADMLEKYDVSPDYIRLELTERIFVNDIERVLERMQFIIELGVSFSLDDFGTGYSSLSYLNILPIAELKIDKSFVDNVQNVGRSRSIVDTVVLLASALKLKCVAEGVESIEQVEHLKHYEGLLMQGYYFAKPMDKSVWLEYIFQSSKVINQ